MRYSVLGPLMGGFGSQAFLGCAHEEGQPPKAVVMVFLPDEIVEKPDVFEQLLAETEVAAHIDHVNVIGVFGLARIDDGYARIVEYADAESLLSVKERALKTGEQIPLPIALRIAGDAAMGVHYAHELGASKAGAPLIHGAIRPGTLLVSYRGMTKVTGYGAAILAEGLAKSRGTTLSESDAYTAPEQLLGGRNAATVQTDVYALGAVLFEALCGRPPPRADAPDMERIVAEALLGAADRIPPEVTAIVQRAMRRRAVERFQTALELRQALLDLGLSASDEDVSRFMASLFGQDHPARMARRKLLQNAHKATPLESQMLAPRPEGDARPAPSPPPKPPAPTPPLMMPPMPPMPAAPTPLTPVVSAAPEVKRVVYQAPPALYVALGLFGGGLIALLVVFLTRDAPSASAPSQATTPTPAPEAPAPKAPPGPAPPAAPVPPPPKAAEANPSPPSSAEAEEGKREATRRPTRRAPREATLRISTTPALSLDVDGKRVGRGTATVLVKPGRHIVRARDPKQGIDVRRTVRVRGGKTEAVAIEVGKGKLVLDAPPGSDVFIGGRKIGTTPLSPIELYEGRHNVLVKKDGVEYRHRVPIRAGLEATLTVRFYDE